MSKSRKHSSDDINILLVGETGVGKSTFINSFANYLQYEKLSSAKNSKLICLIPTKFTVTDDNGEAKLINFMKDNNEDGELGNSSTQAAKGYVFPFEKKMIRLIDTPGNGDHRGLLQDRENFDDVLRYIGEYSHLHAICFFMKPDVTVINAYFRHCLIDLLSRLDRSAAKNILFLFTNTRGKDYTASDTLYNLRRLLKEIQANVGVSIPLNTTASADCNVFCFDNEGFKYLVALQQNAQMGNLEMMEKSWDMSYQASWRLIRYILGDEKRAPLPPHKVRDTCSVNEARRQIIIMSKPLADISDLIQDNLAAIERHRAKVVQEDLSKTELQDMLYVPVINIEQTVLTQPVTICAASKCSEIVTVSGQKKYHYKQRCHNPCYLTNVPKEIINAQELRKCAAMSGNICKVCGCDFSTHMHIYYETRTYETRIEDKTVQTQLQTSDQIIKVQYDTILKLEKRANEYTSEHKAISLAMAKFAYFLTTNSICPYNDAYEEYLEYLIQREKVFNGDKNLVKRYESLKSEHIEQKKLLEKAAKQSKKANISYVSSEEILDIKKNLYALNHTGALIQQLYQGQNAAQRKERSQNNEYVHDLKAKMPQAQQSQQPKSKKKGNKQEVIQRLLETKNYKEAMKHLSELIEEKEKEANEKAAASTSTQKAEPVDAMMQVMGMLQELVTDKTQQKKEENSNKGAPNLPKSGQSATNRANKQQNVRGMQHNQANRGQHNEGNRGPHNQLKGAGNRNQPHFNQPKFNHNSGQFNQNQRQFNPNPHQCNQNPNQFNQYPNQFNSNPNMFNQNPNQCNPNQPNPFNPNQFNPIQQFHAMPHFVPPTGPQMPFGQQPLNINVNLSGKPDAPVKSDLESIGGKYLDPPPAYSNIVNDNSPHSHPARFRGARGNQRGAPRGGRGGGNRGQQQFKKATQRKYHHHSNDDEEEDGRQSDASSTREDRDEKGEDIARMKKFLAEQRRMINEQTARREEDQAGSASNITVATRSDDHTATSNRSVANRSDHTDKMNTIKKAMFQFFKNNM